MHTPAIEQRLAAVKRLIGELGGSLPHYTFFPEGNGARRDGGGPVVVHDKFIGLDSKDLVTILAVPDEREALAFRAAVAAEAGVKDVALSPLVPMREAIEATRRAREARDKAGYAAPGGASAAWRGEEPKPSRRRRKRAPVE